MPWILGDRVRGRGVTWGLRERVGWGCLAAVERIDRQVLRAVSRSFYLSLRLLPGPMQPALSLGYLLARASDSLADTETVGVEDRLELLDGFADELAGKGAGWRGRKLAAFIERQEHAGERVLLERLGECFEGLGALDVVQADAVRKTVGVIVGGQRLDLLRFEAAAAGSPRALKSGEELEDYCYRVAGCVGVFWTRIGLLTLGDRFSVASPGELEELGLRYGKGLQLLNILRDVPEDLAQGRCYLPVGDPCDASLVASARAEWLERAVGWLEAGRRYSSLLGIRRLRAASVLPAVIGGETLELMRGAIAASPDAKIKVSRATVRRALWRAWWWPRIEGR